MPSSASGRLHDRFGGAVSRRNCLRRRQIADWTSGHEAGRGRAPGSGRVRPGVRRGSCGLGGVETSPSIALRVSYAINLAKEFSSGSCRPKQSGACGRLRCCAGLVADQLRELSPAMERDAFIEVGLHFLRCRFKWKSGLAVYEVPSSVAVNNSLMVANCPARFAIVAGLSWIRSSSSSKRMFFSCSSRSIRAM